jgi:ribose 1,5-bisphosphokinase PhnN
MDHKLSQDEYDALAEVAKLPRGTRPSACVGRNTKRLSGIKLMTHRRDGSLELTDSGRQMLFIKQCIDGLRAVANVPGSVLAQDVAAFLGKKGHVAVNAETGLLEATPRGRESLADIEANKIQV